MLNDYLQHCQYQKFKDLPDNIESLLRQFHDERLHDNIGSLQVAQLNNIVDEVQLNYIVDELSICHLQHEFEP